MSSDMSAVLESLIWRRPGQADAAVKPPVTKSGMPMYNGSAVGFTEWRYRVESKWNALAVRKDEDRASKRAELAAQVLDGLSDDALTIVRDFGARWVSDPEAVPKLVEALGLAIAQKSVLEAKELYREGAKVGGLLSRQRGEPMTGYASRRKRWHQRVRELDVGFSIPEALQTDMLLECSGLPEAEQRLIMQTLKSEPSFSAVADALKEHYPRIHEKERGGGKGRGRVATAKYRLKMK